MLDTISRTALSFGSNTYEVFKRKLCLLALVLSPIHHHPSLRMRVSLRAMLAIPSHFVTVALVFQLLPLSVMSPFLQYGGIIVEARLERPSHLYQKLQYSIFVTRHAQTFFVIAYLVQTASHSASSSSAPRRCRPPPPPQPRRSSLLPRRAPGCNGCRMPDQSKVSSMPKTFNCTG